MKIDRAEVFRYMRTDRAKVDAVLESRLAAVETQVLAAVRPAAYWQLVKVEGCANAYRVGPLELASRNLYRELASCPHAFLFCATLGAGVDALLRQTACMSAADLVMVQAVAAALIEAYCDECETRMAAEVAAAGETLRMRFSPGYGDLPLATQKPLLAALDAQRRAGITLSETFLMMPSKSVSAIIGAGPAGGARPRSCQRCGKQDCEFRIEE